MIAVAVVLDALARVVSAHTSLAAARRAVCERNRAFRLVPPLNGAPRPPKIGESLSLYVSRDGIAALYPTKG